MDKETRQILSKNIINYKYKNRVSYGCNPNPFPLSWKTIWSIVSEKKRESFSLTTQRLILDFFKHKYRLKDRNYVITKENKKYDN